MNFFEHQAKARRRTALLVIPFVLAVVLITVTLNLVGFLIFTQTQAPVPELRDWLALPYWIWISLATVAVIGAGSLKTTLQLSGGGKALAEMVGARRISRDSTDADERRLINIVDEMSIASGTPAPLIYVLDGEASINAFVAGLRPTETVLVVTEGAMRNFPRDEMQGVIGHEYSHIFNGDMRLNMRLMGVLAGILLIGQIGRFILRSGRRSRGKGSGQIMLLGLAMFLIGYIGLFFGALIKAAVSRQREFLADASSVQFTRNPDGIAGALCRIKEHAEGSRLVNSHADDVSHFCFGEAVATGFTSLMATHPPLDQRIRAIDPNFMLRRRSKRAAAKTPVPEPGTAGSRVPDSGIAAGFSGGAAQVSAAGIAESVGNLTSSHLALAERVHSGISGELLDALHRPESAPAVCYALVLAGMGAGSRPAGLELLRARDSEGAVAAERLLPAVSARAAEGRLPLVNLALPAMKSQPPEGKARILDVLRALVAADKRVTVFEFALVTILGEHLAEGAEREVPVRYFKTEAVLEEIRLVLSVLARAGSRDDTEMRASFRLGMAQFQRDPGDLVPSAACSLNDMEAALGKLEQLAPLLKRSVVEACADCVIRDKKVLPAEAEILQALAVTLDCPLPPLAA
ncbi:MAG: M48 family metallopeptidase [Gammaproteobacteria bacterium]|nr:M48 family metallopeptidase [Gammaproteobacteria bacterium]